MKYWDSIEGEENEVIKIIQYEYLPRSISFRMGKNSSNFNSSKFLHRWKTMEESFILEQVLDKFEEARRGGERSKKERFCSLLHGRRCNFSDKGITFVEISVDEIKHF